ncbi:hypothetical protein LPN01_15775 [Sphingomonas sp. A2-49]|uniref:hypothetical protein n=1 Tax=Sphingomonas sp. A2-49 TaxID=1391375 RepID=UPI0021D38AE1|nr:hypothetical protein [Sphingomonas sp. A2-49]MCU6455538.1 hypothetical protein [Sphingomonas sp. A2-49]
MGTTLNATFDTRREAEMTVERLVQEHGIDRADVVVAASGDRNTAGVERAGSDTDAGAPGTDARDDAALQGAVIVTVEIDDEATVAKVREAFGEFDAAAVREA